MPKSSVINRSLTFNDYRKLGKGKAIFLLHVEYFCNAHFFKFATFYFFGKLNLVRVRKRICKLSPFP